MNIGGVQSTAGLGSRINSKRLTNFLSKTANSPSRTRTWDPSLAIAPHPRVALAQTDAVALPPHPFDDEPDAAPVVEPRVQRTQCRRLRRELNKAERGDEERAATVEDRARAPLPRRAAAHENHPARV